MRKKKAFKRIGAALTMAIIVTGLAGCGPSDEPARAAADEASKQPEEGQAQPEAPAAAGETEADSRAAGGDIRGSITMAGSTSMEKLANAVAETFMEKYPGVTVNAEFTGSSAGVESLLAGGVDIGNSSRELKESEKEAGAVENIVAIDGIAVVVDPENAVKDLTREQLTGIYQGDIKNWKELGGSDQAIVVVGREAGSGTRGAFEEILAIEDACSYANELESTGAVMAKVASTPGAIGYVSLDVVDESVSAVSLESVEATADTIKAGEYFLSRPFVMATRGEIPEQNEAVQALFAWLASGEGKEVITSVGLITAD